MKLFVLSFFIGLCVNNSVFGQWQIIPSGTVADLVDIRFVSDSIGYILSDDGKILKSTDEGNTWLIIDSLNGNFTSLANVGNDTIFAGGDYIYKSIDGGNSWINIATLGFTITDMEFFSGQRGIYIKPETYICNSSQGSATIWDYEAWQTSDSGSTWQIAFQELIPTSRLQLINDSSAYVAGGYYSIFDHCSGMYINNGMITKNQGINWISSSLSGARYCNFSFTNDSSGYLVTSDFGYANLLRRMENSVTSFVRRLPFYASQVVSINKIDTYILNGNNIYATHSEGLVWNLDTLPGINTLTKIWNNHNISMYAIGANGIILKKQIIESLYPDTVYGMTANETSIQFDTVFVGGDKMKQVTIHNDGSVPININISASDTFLVSTSNNIYSSNLTFTLAAQRDSVINVRFVPGDTLLYEDTLIVSTDSINSIFIPLSGSGTTNLIGQLSDTLYLCGDTINVIGNFTINDGARLVICPGTVIYFRGDYGIQVSGTLIAEGLSNDSIWFTPENTTIGWSGIGFNATNNPDTSIMRYCTLNYVHGGIKFAISCWERTNMLIDHCVIHKSRGGIDCSYSSITISNNRIFDNDNVIGSNGCGIKCFYSSPLILNNEIYNNRAPSGAGIYAINHDPPYPRIIQNLIFNNSATSGVGAVYLREGNPYLFNNTICNNLGNFIGGVQYWVVDSNTAITNNIIYNNSGSQLVLYQPANVTVSYNNIQGGFSGGIGIVNQDPAFVNPTDSIGVMTNIGNYDWSLTSGSPCINAGDTTYNSLIPQYDFIGNQRIYNNVRIDIGAYEYQGFVSIMELMEESDISLFPNPVVDKINVRLSNNELSEIIFYDISLRIMFKQQFTGFSAINLEQFAKGIYTYELKTKSGVIKQGKVVKL